MTGFFVDPRPEALPKLPPVALYMIDFRYHLVSLVSVFLALAVGIVLGAGPLKDPISEGLSARVDALRQDRDALGAQLKTAQAATSNRDTFITDVQDHLIAGQLEGRSVVLLTLPGAEADAVGPLTQAVAAAGGRLTGRVDLQDAWADPASRSARDSRDRRPPQERGRHVRHLCHREPDAVPVTDGQRDGRVCLGHGCRRSARPRPGHDRHSPAERPDETSRTLLDGLAHAGLVNVNGDIPGRANAVVILAPGVATAVQGSGSHTDPVPHARRDARVDGARVRPGRRLLGRGRRRAGLLGDDRRDPRRCPRPAAPGGGRLHRRHRRDADG